MLNNDNYLKIFFTTRTLKSNSFIMTNIMNNLSLKYNKNFMDYDIYRNLEKFICEKGEKKYVIQFTN